VTLKWLKVYGSHSNWYHSKAWVCMASYSHFIVSNCLYPVSQNGMTLKTSLVVVRRSIDHLQLNCLLVGLCTYSSVLYHFRVKCITVVQTVLTATFNSYENRQISTPYKINTLNRSTKNSAQLITSASEPPIPNLVQIHPLRASGQMDEI